MAQALVNGHDGRDEAELIAVDDIREIAAKIQASTSVVEAVRAAGASFEQASHTLMMESVDKITNQWVGELENMRQNTRTVETMVIQQAAKVKEELTKLHLLGVQTMREAERGNDLAQHLSEELDTMLADYHGN